MRNVIQWLALILMSVGCLGAGPLTGANDAPIYHSSQPGSPWWTINDTVMGGRSQSTWLQPVGKPAVFEGLLSLENNGGFTSVRSGPIPATNGQFSSFQVTVRGDGRTYQFIARSRRLRQGINYQAGFATQANTLTTVKLPLSAFQARWRGRDIDDAPPLSFDDLHSVGFLLADKRPGPFRLEVHEVRAIP